MNFRKHERSEPAVRLPLAALIDVVLFLLMYFIMAGSLAPAESQLSAAVVAARSGGSSGSSLATQVVRVESVGGTVRVRVGERVVADRAALRELLERLPKEQGVVIRADDSVPIFAAASVLQAARDAGFVRISYVAGK
jgi:biopolymer transport protein ExbD